MSIQRQIYPSDLERKGGDWLGAARSWIQQNRINGSTVTWGSPQQVRPNMTVKDIEDLAAHVAAATMNAIFAEMRQRIGKCPRLVPKSKENQVKMMTLTGECAEIEQGHWYSPDAVQEFIVQAQKKLCDYLQAKERLSWEELLKFEQGTSKWLEINEPEFVVADGILVCRKTGSRYNLESAKAALESLKSERDSYVTEEAFIERVRYFETGISTTYQAL